MSPYQFHKLQVGDKCMVTRGLDSGRVCVVLYKEGQRALIRTEDGEPFDSPSTTDNLRLIRWSEIKIAE